MRIILIFQEFYISGFELKLIFVDLEFDDIKLVRVGGWMINEFLFQYILRQVYWNI